jgi:copper chaperone CopZ
MKNIILFFINIFLLTTTVLAGYSDIIHIKVNGLVCDFCARSTEKIFYKEKDVAGVKVDLDKGLVIITMKQGKTLSDTKIENLIHDAGYSLEGIYHQKPTVFK